MVLGGDDEEERLGRRAVVDPFDLQERYARSLRQYREWYRTDGSERFRLRYVIELFYAHRDRIDRGADQEAQVLLEELAFVAEAGAREDPDWCAQMQKVWWARALDDAQQRAATYRRTALVVGLAERGRALRRSVPDLVELDDTLCALLERAHAATLRVRSLRRAADFLGDLRFTTELCEGDIEGRRLHLCRALTRAHAHARRDKHRDRARAFLAELRRYAGRPHAPPLQLIALTEALRDAALAREVGAFEELESRALHPLARHEAKKHYADAVAARRAGAHTEAFLGNGIYRTEME